MKSLQFTWMVLIILAYSCSKNSNGSQSNSNSGLQNVATDSFYQSSTGQSPINILSSQAVSYQYNNVAIHYVPFNGSVKYVKVHYIADPNNSQNPSDHYDYRLQVKTNDNQNYITINGTNYYLSTFHFIYRSGHQMDGKDGLMELIFVHNSSIGDVANFSVLIQNGAKNVAIQSVFDSSPLDSLAPDGILSQFNPSSLLPSDSYNYFTYSGSFMSPGNGNLVTPYYTPVIWLVAASPLTITSQQYAQYKAIYTIPANRAIQPIGGRTVYRHIQ